MEEQQVKHHSVTRRLAVLAFFIGVPFFGIVVPLVNMWMGLQEWNLWPLFWFGVWMAGPLVMYQLAKRSSEGSKLDEMSK